MDIATHTGSMNGLDILLWVAFLYLAPRLLNFVPRARARARQPQPRPQLRRVAHVVHHKEAFLKSA